MSGNRIWAAVGSIAVLAVTAGGAAAWRSAAPYGHIGAVYLSKQVCSCVFVAGRSEAGCRKEFEPDVKTFNVTVVPGAADRKAEVRATLGAFVGRATYEPGFGCTVAE